MDEQVPGGRKRMETVAEGLEQRLIDDDGRSPAAEEVADVVEATAQDFADAPVQDFVPLLVEHQAGERLRERGLRADLTGGAQEAPPPSDDQPDNGLPADSTAPESPGDVPLPPR